MPIKASGVSRIADTVVTSYMPGLQVIPYESLTMTTPMYEHRVCAVETVTDDEKYIVVNDPTQGIDYYALCDVSSRRFVPNFGG